MPTTLDIDTLRALLAIVALKSFSRAAEQLGRSQSAISLQIARLEAVVGHPLLERIRGRVLGPTAKGAELVTHAREMIALNDRTIAAMRWPPEERVRLGMPADFLERDFASAFDEVRSRFPKARLSVRTDVSARLAEDVSHGRLDLAFYKRAPTNEVRAAIAFEPMAWFGKTTASGRSVDAVPLVAFADGCAYRGEALRSLDLAGRAWGIACEARSLSGLVGAVKAGLGYAALPTRLGERKSLRRANDLAGLPQLNAVELALGIAEGCNLPFARAIGGIIAERCALA
ncbi:LysR family transcriptional regulator [Bradyrhizobium guangdongense]|uniref:LysR family transcriptional regulator n=1 Tax=Bradyrhizobium guangdongense TaxID=1325090 RepID=A0A410V081_9BRAD|nr:LysR substrate-binding domain-containing protein [Bradyrhizobium guangdongense]QAU37081.1 LysR family transcriptional regulator [Bradyrhizobium guangdongense]QOZ58137.1 LysR family transcriptional regulator [Bradyrhizobium guangdongense]GGI32717.1 LysR family transcriptional regulator [Bradyrhizobium guangdongense]